MLRICHLYPELLNLHGDRGNVIAIKQRCAWRGIEADVCEVKIGETFEPEQADILYLGGGSDRAQALIATDIAARRAALSRAVEDGLVVLAICGGYRMLGKYYSTDQGQKIPGLALIDIYTEPGKTRFAGNCLVEMKIGEQKVRVAGFENHAERTYLGPNVRPLGRVLHGHGNNGEDKTEGARYKNVFGSYLHGPLLPKNSYLTDLLIELALRRRAAKKKSDPKKETEPGLEEHLPLAPLDDTLETAAVQVMTKRLLKKK